LKSTGPGTERIIFDLSGLEYLSSSGIELFENLNKKIGTGWDNLIWTGITEPVRKVLVLYGYQNRFPQFRNLTEAGQLLLRRKNGTAGQFEPFQIRCSGCGNSQTVCFPGLTVCGDCGFEHRVSSDGVVSSFDNKPEVSETNRNTIPEAGVGIFGEKELVETLSKGTENHSHCISIGNPGQAVPEIIVNTYERVLRIEFFDVDSVEDLLPGQEKRIPEKKDVVEIIKFYKATHEDADGYDIHCWQGVSRSTAAAMGVMKLMGIGEAEIEALLLRIRPTALPHKKIVRYFDDELNSDLSRIAESIHKKRIARMRMELEKIVNGV